MSLLPADLVTDFAQGIQAVDYWCGSVNFSHGYFLPAQNRAQDGRRLALAQLPRCLRRRVLVRADSGGGTHEFQGWLTPKSRRLHYSVAMTITKDIQAAVLKVPADVWTPAYDLTCDRIGGLDGGRLADLQVLMCGRPD